MNLHRRAKTCPESGALLVRRLTLEAGVSRQTARKWLTRFSLEGKPGCWTARLGPDARPASCTRSGSGSWSSFGERTG